MLTLFVLFATLFVTEARVRVVNEADCAVRVRVLQNGAALKTISVNPLATREVTVKLRSSTEKLTYTITGVGCRFDRYNVDGVPLSPAVELRVTQAPHLAQVRVIQ